MAGSSRNSAENALKSSWAEVAGWVARILIFLICILLPEIVERPPCVVVYELVSIFTPRDCQPASGRASEPDEYFDHTGGQSDRQMAPPSMAVAATIGE